MSEEFNPKSPHAMFAMILGELKSQSKQLQAQDETAERERKEIKLLISGVSDSHKETKIEHEKRINEIAHDVGKLKTWRATSKAKIAVLITVASIGATVAWAIIQQVFFK